MVVSVVALLPAHLAIILVSVAGVLEFARLVLASRRCVEHFAGVHFCRILDPGVRRGSAAAPVIAAPASRLT